MLLTFSLTWSKKGSDHQVSLKGLRNNKTNTEAVQPKEIAYKPHIMSWFIPGLGPFPTSSSLPDVQYKVW